MADQKPTKKKILPVIIIVLLVLLISGAVLGYLATRKTDTQEAKEPEKTEEAAEETATVETSNLIWMCGRSVMAGWFEYWGGNIETPLKKSGYTLVYKNLYDPPTIADTVKVFLDDRGKEKPVVFFKLCFVDFIGGSRADAENNLAEHQKYIRTVYQTVVKDNKLKLLIGNSLPQVSSLGDEHLLWNYEEYNKWLDDFAKAHQDEVAVFDFYEVLAGSNGYLKPEYANSSDDAHPNAAAYAALDKKFFDFLEDSLK